MKHNVEQTFCDAQGCDAEAEWKCKLCGCDVCTDHVSTVKAGIRTGRGYGGQWVYGMVCDNCESTIRNAILNAVPEQLHNK